METLEARIKGQAHALGFELAGIAPAAPADGFERLRDWLDRGYAGEMDYMRRHAEARRHPAAVLPEVRSVVMVGMSYAPPPPAPPPRGGRGEPAPLPPRGGGAGGGGKVALYARGADYHDVLRRRLNQLLARVQ